MKFSTGFIVMAFLLFSVGCNASPNPTTINGKALCSSVKSEQYYFPPGQEVQFVITAPAMDFTAPAVLPCSAPLTVAPPVSMPCHVDGLKHNTAFNNPADNTYLREYRWGLCNC